MMILRPFSKRAWRRIVVFALVFAVLFSLTAVAQIAFVQVQTANEEIRVLKNTADQVSQEIYPGKWDLRGYLQSDFRADTGYVILTGNGLLVDFELFVHGLIAQGKPIDEDIYGKPKLLTTEIGDTWLLAGKKLRGGSVVAGIANPAELKDPESLLRDSLGKFGKSVDTAMKIKSRAINQQVDYAILDEFGDVRDVQTGFPLKVKLASPDDYKIGNAYQKKLKGASYEVFTKPIVDSSGKTVGTVLTFDDISGQLQVLETQKRFVLFVAFLAWLTTALGATLYIVTDERKRRQQEVSLEEALRVGESQAVEFKEGIEHPDKIKDVARAIAGFANSNPGNIFIGIKDTGEVVGVRLTTTKEWDDFQKRIREIAVQMVSPPIRVRVTRFDHHSKSVVRIFVPRGDAPVYFAEKVPYIRDVTSVSRAGPEDLPLIFRSFSRIGV